MTDQQIDARLLSDAEYSARKADLVGNDWRKMVETIDAADLAKITEKRNNQTKA